MIYEYPKLDANNNNNKLRKVVVCGVLCVGGERGRVGVWV